MHCFKIGCIVNTHGINGTVKVYPYTDDIQNLLDIQEIYFDEKCTQKVAIKNIRSQKNMLLMDLDGIDTIEKAEKLKNKYIYILESQENLADGMYYVCDVIGCQVVTDDGNTLGKVSDVFSTSANDVYEVKTDNGNIYLPAISDVIKQIDIERKVIIVHLIEGLV